MSRESIKSRLAKLLVEGFLDELNPPHFVEAEGAGLGFDYVIAFRKPDQGLKYFAIEVKTTEEPLAGTFNFMTGRRFFDAARNSNMPTVIVVADTKRNEIYYGFASE